MSPSSPPPPAPPSPPPRTRTSTSQRTPSSSSPGCPTSRITADFDDEQSSTINGSGSSNSVALLSPWKRMSVTTSENQEDGGEKGRRSLSCQLQRTCCRYLHMHYNWTGLAVSGLVFAVIVTAGMLLLQMHIKSVENEHRIDALDIADETTLYFINSFNKATMPLFSLAQLAVEIPIFRSLPDAIGPPFQNGSLPFLPPPRPDMAVSHRNLTGSPCLDPTVVNRYNQIASTVKENFNIIPGILLQLYMMPQAVGCLIYPMKQTLLDPQTQEEVVMDVSDQLGIDLLEDKQLRYHGEKTLNSTEMVVAGPITLRNCVDRRMDCHPLVNSAIIARVPIQVPDHEIVLPSSGRVVNRWGMVVATINWKALVEQEATQHLFQRFSDIHCEFSLARKDRLYQQTSESITLAESSGYQKQVNGSSSPQLETVTVTTTSGEEWTIAIQCNADEMTTFRKWVSVLIFLVSLLVSGLVYKVLAQKQEMTTKAKTQEARVETERNMTAYFAHELRNPLSAIDSALVAMPDEDLPPSVIEMHDGMRLCSTFMKQVMNNLCDVRQLEEGRMEFHNTSFDLDKLLLETYNMLLPSVKCGVKLQHLVHDNVKKSNCVMGDYHRILQVLTNVTSNAIKYTSTGSITISVQWDNHDNVRFECVDTGPGIPLSEQAQLFKRFVKRGGAPGNGLGLAISKHIVDSMKGTIYFESNPTITPGATCIVILPLQPVVSGSSSKSLISDSILTSTATTTTKQQQPKASKRPSFNSGDLSLVKINNNNTKKQPSPPPSLLEEEISILIVDDVKVNRLMLRKRILKCVAPSAKIEERETGEAALELLRQQQQQESSSSNYQSSPATTSDGENNNRSNNIHRFDVIVMDQYMESAGGALLGTDTIIAIRRMTTEQQQGTSSSLSSSKSKTTAPMIIGSSGNDLTDEFLEAGANKVWQKPLPSNAEMIKQLRDGLGL